MKYLLIVALAVSAYAWGYTDLARDVVANRLKDPQSARFKELHIKRNIICGQVNAKNGFGGYTGFQYFLGGGKIVYFQSDFTPKQFLKIWNEFCR